MVTVSILTNAEFGPNDHCEDTPQIIKIRGGSIWSQEKCFKDFSITCLIWLTDSGPKMHNNNLKVDQTLI